MNKQGSIFVVTGPSGVGKDSVIEGLRESGLQFGSVITTSTRAQRDYESEGHPYYFIDRPTFEAKIAAGEMIEWAEVYGNLYGSTRSEIDRVKQLYDIVIIKVDPQGARTFQNMLPEAKTIFIVPPSVNVLEKHLMRRASDSPDVIAKRLASAREELDHQDQWDYVVLNEEGKLEDTIARFKEILNMQ